MRTVRITTAIACLVLGLVVVLAASGPGIGASTGGSTVGATVASATTLDAAGCASGVAGKTDFGTITASSSNVTTVDCTVAFGSSNDSSQLRMGQADTSGVGMWSPTRGAPNTGFGTGGGASTPVAPGAGTDYGYAVGVQSDGKVVVAGQCDLGGATGRDVCLVRYTTAGVLDGGYGSGGVITTDIAPGAASDSAHALVVQPDDKVVVAGGCVMGGATGTDFCLARYTTGGVLDPTFGTGGRTTTGLAPGAAWDEAWAIAQQPDGKILAAGECNNGGATGIDMCVARYTTAGVLDTTWGVAGKASTGAAPTNRMDVVYGLAVQADGKVLAAGQCDVGGATGYDNCIVRYSSAGVLDNPGWGGTGVVTTPIAPGNDWDLIHAIALQADGKVVVAAECEMGGGDYDYCAARYSTAGVPDPTWGGAGTVSHKASPTGYDVPYSIAVQADGKVLLGGSCQPVGNPTCLMRLTTTGGLDPTMGTGGVATLPVSLGETPRAMALQPDGRVVVAGDCNLALTGVDLCAASFDRFATFSQYADDGVSDWDTAGGAPNLFGACLRSVVGGATAQWATNAGCPATDGPYWNAVPTSTAKIAYNVGPVPDPPATAVNLRFGLRASAAQAAGTYVAPIRFEVLAPNA